MPTTSGFTVKRTRAWKPLLVAAMVPVAACAAGATAGSQQAAGAGGSGYTVHWCVTTKGSLQSSTGVDWADRVEFDGAPIRKDAVIFYMSQLGRFPFGGPHELVDGKASWLKPGENWMERHLKQVEIDVQARIPDPNWSGLAVIDYEGWNLSWDLTPNIASSGPSDARDRDYQDDWRDYLMAKDPAFSGMSGTERQAYMKQTYEATARDFFTQTIRKCKQLRPSAKWSFFAYPPKLYISQLTPKGVIGYGDLSHRASAINDEMAWLYQEMDFVCPSIYAIGRTVPDGQKPNVRERENSIQTDRQYVLSNIREAVRLANGKPVYAITTPKYKGTQGWEPKDRFLEDINLRHQLELPREAGAAGVIIWDGIESVEYFQKLNEYVKEKLAAEVKRMTGVSAPANGAAASNGGSAKAPEAAPAPSQAPAAQTKEEKKQERIERIKTHRAEKKRQQQNDD